MKNESLIKYQIKLFAQDLIDLTNEYKKANEVSRASLIVLISAKNAKIEALNWVLEN